jgi:hypothetical protein
MVNVALFINDVKKSFTEIKIIKEGDRAIDEADLKIPYTVDSNTNDKIIIISDSISVDKLSAIYNFNETVIDESGHLNEPTASADLTYIDGQWGGKALSFNGTSTYFEVNDKANLNFSGEFETFIWVKFSSTNKQYLLTKRTTSSNGLGICVNHTTAGDIALELGGTTLISSSAGFNDGANHLIRVTRDSSNLVTLYIDKVSKGTATISHNLTTTGKLRVGRDETNTYFTGSMDSVRLYKGISFIINTANKLYDLRNPRTVMKFGGKVTKVSKETVYQKVKCFSFGKELAEVEIRGDQFDNQTPETIIESLVTNNTGLTFIRKGNLSGMQLKKYVAVGKLIDILRDFTSLTGHIFYTNGNKEFVLEPEKHTNINFTFTHGVNCKVFKSAYDDTEIVNDLIVLGENIRYHTIEAFTGNGNNTVFTLKESATSTRVISAGSEMTPETHYEVDSSGKTITFTTAPVNGAAIFIDYEFERPLYIRGTKPDSITEHGVHAKKLIMPWIRTRFDGVRFVQSYLNRYKDIRLNVKIEIPTLFNSVAENDIIHLINTIKNIDSDFVVKGITWTFPNYITMLNVGEYSFDFLEIDQQITGKIHDLEDAMTTNKDIREFESPEETFVINDVVIQVVHEDFTETLNIAHPTVIIDKNDNNYGTGTYGSQHPPNRQTGSVYVSG